MISPDKKLARKLNVIAVLISIVVMILVLLMRRVKIDTGIDFSFLPPIHSTFNALAAVFLIMGLRAIKKRDAHKHRLYMVIAIVLSVLFLTSYVVYRSEERRVGSECVLVVWA